MSLGNRGSEVSMLRALQDFVAHETPDFQSLLCPCFCCSVEVISLSLCAVRFQTGPICNGTSPLYLSLVNFVLKFLDLTNRAFPHGPECSLWGQDEGQKKTSTETHMKISREVSFCFFCGRTSLCLGLTFP